jgi:hypothetical protein
MVNKLKNMKMAVLEKHLNKEDVPANNVGGGAIAGLGVGPDGEPGIKKKKKLDTLMGFIRRKQK